MTDKGTRPGSAAPDAGSGECSEAGALWPALVLLFAGLAVLATASLFRPGAEGHFLVITRPGQDAVALVTAAGGAFLGNSGFSNIVTTASDAPDFAEFLINQGAVAVLPAPEFMGCSGPSETGSV